MSSALSRSLPRLLVLALFAGATGACSAILPPDEKDDGVNRCNTSNDCPEFSDNRLQAACVEGEGQEGGDKVCVADFKSDLRCDPDQLAGDHPLVVKYAEITALQGVYLGCEEQTGELMCRPIPGSGCNQGLDLVDGRCVDGSLNPKPVVPSADNKGQDVLDQYCRWYFCSDDFVCGETGFCVPCSNNANFGTGGCGEIYIGSEPSSIYKELNGCDGGNISPTTTDAWGPTPTAN